jgi:acid phosphatase (class A)
MNAEIDMLLNLVRARTAATSNAIIDEQDIQTATIGGFTVAELLYPENETALSRLLVYGWEDLATITLAEKEYFNRVRPDKADARIQPMIEVPRHPAYPSGHSTQSHYLALVIGLVYPDVADELMLRADEIAIHREIAGVHYPSDTAAGVILAEQFVTALQRDPVFQLLLTEAREEAYNQ